MQINRLFQMIYVLLERSSVTARELADKFEVSTRTVYRDLEVLSAAGIPVYAVSGRGGGIRILPGFVLDKSLLSQEEQSGILSALQGLRAVGDPDSTKVLEKVSALFQQSGEPWVAVEFSGWSGRAQTFERLKVAVQKKEMVIFDYYGANREPTQRTVEPLQLYFKGTTWYLKAYCKQAEAMRLFRLSRIHNLEETGAHFIRVLEQEVEQADAAWEQAQTQVLLLHIDRSHGYRVYDDFDPHDVEEQSDGSFLVSTRYPVDQWAVSFLLSYGPAAQVLEPVSLRQEICEVAQRILENYREGNNGKKDN